MSSVYVANVTGDGLSSQTAYRPNGFDGKTFSVLMIDRVKSKALLLSQDDTVTGTGITNLLTASSVSALRAFASTNSPTLAQRTALTSWLTTNSYVVLTSAQVSWLDCFNFIGRQVNTAADLNRTGI